MKANKSNILYFLNNSNSLETPVYQGCYSWGLDKCEKLMSDVLNLCESNDSVSYFLGIVLHIEKKNYGLKNSIMLDGWQRLMTFSLILAAIRETITEDEDDEDLSYAKLHKYLFVKDGESYKPKMLVSPYDKATFDTIITGGEIDSNLDSIQLIQNYNYFKEQIENSKWTLKKIFNALLKCEVVNITLEDGVDNPNLVFESINSSGVEISAIEQIKNEIMMNLDRDAQVKIYENYWVLIEEGFKEHASIEILESFLTSYLTIQNQGRLVEENNLYQEFRRFYNKMLKLQDREKILDNLLKYANYYLKLYSLKINSRKVKRHVKKINQSAGDKAYPFLMEIMDDLENGLINEDLLAEILKSTINLINESDEKEFSFNDLSGNINKMLALKDFIPKIVIDKTHEPLIKPKGAETINDIIKATGS